MKLSAFSIRAVTAATLLLWVIPASAAVLQVNDRAGFAAPFNFDFSAFGAPGGVVSTQESRTVNGVTITVQTSGGSFGISREGAGYTGNFKLGDTLLTQSGLSDNFILRFSGMPIYGVGTQFEPFSAAFLGSYGAILDVYDTNGRQIADFDLAGVKTSAENNSVPFLGALSTDVPIGYVAFSVATNRAPFFTAGDVAANTLTLSTTRMAVPEPASLTLLAVGVMACVGRLRRGKTRSSKI
ncbi:MAG: PEP-CTERM sorting domain-containing protein [Janthinobacterium lividum]